MLGRLLPCFNSAQTECIPLPFLLLVVLSRPCYPAMHELWLPSPSLAPTGAARLTAVETAHPFSTVSGTSAAYSQHSSASSASSGAEAFTCSSRGKKCSEPVLCLFPFSSWPRLHCLNFRLTGLFSLDFVFVFLRGHQTISSKKASLFNLNILRQSEGNGPHRPSAAWQVSMSQEERRRLKCPPSCCYANSQAGGHGVFGRRRVCSQR